MRPSRRIAVLPSLFAACALACAASDFSGTEATSPAVAPDSTDASWEAACEVALRRLDTLLAAEASRPVLPAADVAEARGLRGEALDLMAAAQYQLAFDLITAAIAVLERAP
jgi:hypothetical protein